MWSIFRQTRKFSSTTAPWLMLPPSISGGGGDMGYNFYSVSEGEVVSFKGKGGKEEAELFKDEKTRLVGSSHGWLALSNGSDLFLSNPVTGRRMKLPAPPKPPSKVMVSCGGEGECVAVMIYGPGNRVATCRPGRSHEWTSIGPRSYADFVYSTTLKRLLCISNNAGEDLECWDVTYPPWMDWKDMSLSGADSLTIGLGEIGCMVSDFVYNMIIASQIPSQAEGRQCRKVSEITTKYLVFADGQLYLVTRFYGIPESNTPQGSIHSNTIGFMVHRINRGGESRSLNGSLDGLAMFVGINHSFALPASQYPELKPNSIYFTNHNHNYAYDTGIYQYDAGIYRFDNTTFSPYHFHLHPTHTPLWYTPNL